MSEVYDLVTAAAPPVSLASMQAYLGGPPASRDTIIQELIEACSDWGESFTGREFRANEWTLRLDCFEERITVNRNPVATIDSVTYLVSGSPVTVDSAVYYLKDGVQCSEILLNENQSWPIDGDDREQSITITFTTKVYRRESEIQNGIKRHVAFLYANRGDCCDCNSAEESGALTSYGSIRIARV